VTATDVADEIWRTRKIRVDRRKIDLGDPIKRIGRYDLPIALFEDVRVDVKTLVVPIGGELPPEEELEQMAAEEAAEEAAAAAEAQAPEEPVEYLDEEEDVGVPQAEEPQEGEAPAAPVSEEETVGVPEAVAEPPEPGEGAARPDEP
jgi:large subunit ribosomal protein L9